MINIDLFHNTSFFQLIVLQNAIATCNSIHKNMFVIGAASGLH